MAELIYEDAEKRWAQWCEMVAAAKAGDVSACERIVEALQPMEAE